MSWLEDDISKGCFPLWPKVKRLPISTIDIARNQEFDFSILHTRGQSPKAIALQNAYIAILFYQGDGLSKEVWVAQEWKPKLWLRGRRFVFIEKKVKNW
jgi:hypothetical protein